MQVLELLQRLQGCLRSIMGTGCTTSSSRLIWEIEEQNVLCERHQFSVVGALQESSERETQKTLEDPSKAVADADVVVALTAEVGCGLDLMMT